jgi:hypothetical protein
VKTYGIGDIASQFLASTLDGSDWSVSRPRYPTRVTVGPISGLGTTEKRKIPCPCREWNPGCPARNPSLCRLSYPSNLRCDGICLQGLRRATTAVYLTSWLKSYAWLVLKRSSDRTSDGAPTILMSSEFFYRPSTQMPWWVFKLGHDRFLPHPIHIFIGAKNFSNRSCKEKRDLVF